MCGDGLDIKVHQYFTAQVACYLYNFGTCYSLLSVTLTIILGLMRQFRDLFECLSSGN